MLVLLLTQHSGLCGLPQRAPHRLCVVGALLHVLLRAARERAEQQIGTGCRLELLQDPQAILLFCKASFWG